MAATEAAISGTDKEYETIYVLKPDVEKTRAEDVAARMTDVIAKAGGRLTRVENWGRRVLAYPVARQKRGVYVYLRYVGQGGLVAELERNLRMLDPVIKFQTVKLADMVAAAAYEVNGDDLKFEHAEPPAEEEEDVSLARTLGLEAPLHETRSSRAGDEGDDDLDGDFDDVGSEEEGD
jgi:small subunit ribosomal protein S6